MLDIPQIVGMNIIVPKRDKRHFSDIVLIFFDWLLGFLQELKKYKVIKLDDEEGAGVSTLNIEIPIEARNSVLEATRKAIFEQGQGFDPQPENFANPKRNSVSINPTFISISAYINFNASPD